MTFGDTSANIYSEFKPPNLKLGAIFFKSSKTMAKSIVATKLNMWRQKLGDLEKELEVIMQRRGEAAAMGDLSENAAFQMANEDADVYQTRIDEVRKIIFDLEKKAEGSS